MLGDPSGAVALDAFAGSGALGLEALSRGAARAVFCETSAAALRALRENIARLGVADRVEVSRADARRRMAADAAAGAAYDLILLDPPYRMLAALQEPFSLHLPALLAPGGVVVVESSSAQGPLDLPLGRVASRTYGDVRLTLYRHA